MKKENLSGSMNEVRNLGQGGLRPRKTGFAIFLGCRFVRERQGWEEWLGPDHGRLFASSRQCIYFFIS